MATNSTYAGFRGSTKYATSNYTALTTDFLIICDPGTGTLTITLPTGVEGQAFLILKDGPQGTVYVKSTEGFNRGSQLTLDSVQESVLVVFSDGKWYVAMATIFTTGPLHQFPVFQSNDSLSSESATGYCGYGLSGLLTYADTRNQTVAPIDGFIHSLTAVITGTALTGSDEWKVTLYVNGVASALVVSITAGETSKTDATNRVAVSAGDRLYWKIELVSGTLTHDFAIASVYEAAYQPLFAHISCTSTGYGDLQNAQYNASGNPYIATVMPCPGMLQDIYIYSTTVVDSGDEVTWTLRSFDTGAGTWSDESFGITLNFDSDGSSKADLASSFAVSAGDVLQWKGAETGGITGRVSLSCVFLPTTPGQKIITGSASTWTSNPGYTAAMGADLDDDVASGAVAFNIPVPVSGVVDDLYFACATAPGGTEWREAEVYKNGSTATGLVARATGTSRTGSDTSNSGTFTKDDDDIGVRLNHSGSPASTVWVAWGMAYQ